MRIGPGTSKNISDIKSTFKEQSQLLISKLLEEQTKDLNELLHDFLRNRFAVILLKIEQGQTLEQISEEIWKALQ